MNKQILTKVTNQTDLKNHYVFRNGFVFTSVGSETNVFDGIVIRSPETSNVSSPVLGLSEKTLEEHIALVNEYQLEKAVVVANSLEFITRCPSLRFLNIYPSDCADANFDYSPLYQMPNIEYLRCETNYGTQHKLSTTIDCSRISGLRYLFLSDCGHLNFKELNTLESLNINNFKNLKSLEVFSLNKNLNKLDIVQCSIDSLKGVRHFENLEHLSLCYNRTLSDISELGKVATSLKAFDIINCSKIKDFSVLSQLENLEHLYLYGNNEIEDLSFLKNMKKLKTFVFSVNILNGDLTPCTDVNYVCCLRNRKHYNLRDSDLPKNLS